MRARNAYMTLGAGSTVAEMSLMNDEGLPSLFFSAGTMQPVLAIILARVWVPGYGFRRGFVLTFAFDSSPPSDSSEANRHRRSREAQDQADLRERVSERSELSDRRLIRASQGTRRATHRSVGSLVRWFVGSLVRLVVWFVPPFTERSNGMPV